jgi:hypothetical protein
VNTGSSARILSTTDVQFAHLVLEKSESVWKFDEPKHLKIQLIYLTWEEYQQQKKAARRESISTT